MKPWAVPLAAGCMAESGSRLQQSMDFVGNPTRIHIYFGLSPSVVRLLILVRKQLVRESDLIGGGGELFQAEMENGIRSCFVGPP
ncbi:MAG: hypothetical protein WEB53_08690 [Akkermansiaceae bacterium]